MSLYELVYLLHVYILILSLFKITVKVTNKDSTVLNVGKGHTVMEIHHECRA